ncbi:plasmid replication protein RepC [Tropicibacter alexandrii]|uniref:plasmid replication protein RepC n=1 Tax=Tropicibacter alexandrii TaxID=2267683 RepID=UPI000EF459D7|nr:plasmid replication protein RepC [Tropicibacter alexandrii]
MAFIQAAAPVKGRPQQLLSADNARPERHILIETLRRAAPLMGLKSTVIATLDAMLSCLPPKRQHDTVFASNETLAFRLNGISDRTIRRHAAILQEHGLLIRRDSPNRKRYMRRSPSEPVALRFGFDLSPVFARFAEIAALAAEATRLDQQIAYLRQQIRAAANALLQVAPDHAQALAALRILRRKLGVHDCRALLDTLDAAACPVETPVDDPQEMSANDGQNVRHHQNSEPELIERKTPEDIVTPREITSACRAALDFTDAPVSTGSEIIALARKLAPMMGITSQCYEAAQRQLGAERTALTVWVLLQMQDKIKSLGAYFRAVTTGTRREAFDPVRVMRRLAHAPDPA